MWWGRERGVGITIYMAHGYIASYIAWNCPFVSRKKKVKVLKDVLHLNCSMNMQNDVRLKKK